MHVRRFRDRIVLEAFSRPAGSMGWAGNGYVGVLPEAADDAALREAVERAFAASEDGVPRELVRSLAIVART